MHQRFGVPCHLHKADGRLMCQAHMHALEFDGRQIEPFTAFCLYDDDELNKNGQVTNSGDLYRGV